MRGATATLTIFVAALVAASSTTVSAQEHAPSNLTTSTAGSDVVISWRAGGDDPPDAFRLEAGSAPGLTDLAIVNIPWTAQQGIRAQFAAAGVAPGVYYLRVRGVYDGTITAASEEVAMRVGTSSCPIPAAPSNVSASVANETVTLTWERGAASAAAGYVIEAGTAAGAPNLAIITLDSTQVSITAPPGQYFVRLRSMGLCGASEPSREIVIVVP